MQWQMVRVLEPLLLMWEIQTEFVALDLSRAQPVVQTTIWGINRQMEGLSFSLSSFQTNNKY